MIALLFCLAAFALSFFWGRRGLVPGLCAVFTVGYFYGIVRANYLAPASHFIFDFACLGFFVARFSLPPSLEERIRSQRIRRWMIPLIGWPVFLTLLPVQDYLVQIVGLRGNIFLACFLYYGALLKASDWFRLGGWFCLLNLAAFGFAVAEYRLGVPAFFPENAVTDIIYKSGDVAEGTAFRIPATFSSAHAYGGAIVLTVPLLIGALACARRWYHYLWFASGIFLVGVGVLMCAARLPFIILCLLAATAAVGLRRNVGILIGIVIAFGAVFYVTADDERLQRYTTLTDTEMVTERIAGSVNTTVLQAILEYPLGNGIGGGGTSIPYFLLDRLVNPLYFENEYARIQLELGVPGLLMWVTFIVVSVFGNRQTVSHNEALLSVVVSAAVGILALTGMIGTGLFTAIPSSVLLFCYLGWLNRVEPLRRWAEQKHPASSARLDHEESPELTPAV